MSISFEDLQVGQRWQCTGRTVTDADFAKASNGRQCIFHGTYSRHIAMALTTRFPDLGSDVVGALGFSEWRFWTPLLTGDTVHIEKWAAKSKTGRFFRATVLNILRCMKRLRWAVLSG